MLCNVCSRVIVCCMFLQGLGEVVGVGPDSNLKVGQVVLYSKYGAFSDYIVSICQ